ncbi:MAG: hypothetical protein ACLRVQ_05845 [Lachnospiraceae bacterium]
MSGLLLCTKTAKRPLTIKDSGINLYSMEELCYYIYNNIYIIEPEFFSKELIEFLEKELELEKTAKKLKDQIFRNESYINMIRTILEGGFYYSDEEMGQIEEVLADLGKKSQGDRMKFKADMLAEQGKYEKALNAYRSLLEAKYNAEQTKLLGDIWNNMGVIYARMFLFEDALCCFQKAYNMEGEQEYRDNIICSLIFMENKEKFCELMETYNISEETADRYRRAVMMAEEEVRNNPGIIHETEMFKYTADKELGSYYSDVDSVLDKWKQEYREHI